MSIEISGAYSRDTIYGHLTMPFDNKPVHINAHTPLDEKNDDVSVTKSNFYKNYPKEIVSIKDIRDIKSIELDSNLKNDIGVVELKEFPPESSVSGFQATSYTKQSGVVFDALKNGYTASSAIKIGNAFDSYKKAAAMNTDGNPVKTLLNTNFTVT